MIDRSIFIYYVYLFIYLIYIHKNGKNEEDRKHVCKIKYSIYDIVYNHIVYKHIYIYIYIYIYVYIYQGLQLVLSRSASPFT